MRTPVPALVPILALGAALGTGCQAGPASGEAALDAFPLLAVEPVHRIGSFDDPDLGFSQVASVDVDREGRVYVLESTALEIRVYTPEGEFLRRIGQRGSGPGEFEFPPRFGVLGDTLWTVEGVSNRTTLFTREGTVLETGRTQGVEIPLGTTFGYVTPSSLRPDGTFLGTLNRVGGGGDRLTSATPLSSPPPVPLVRFTPTGAVIDTIGWAPRPPPRLWRPPSEVEPPSVRVTAAGREHFVPSPPTLLPTWSFGHDGYTIVETPLPTSQADARILVTRIEIGGDTVFHREVPYASRPWSSTDLDSIAARAARGEPGGMVPFVVAAGGALPPPPDDWPAVAAVLRGAMAFPPFQIPVASTWISQDGSTWLRLRGEEGTDATWAILDPEGNPRGQVVLPPTSRPVWQEGDALWVVELDAFNVPWVVGMALRDG